MAWEQFLALGGMEHDAEVQRRMDAIREEDIGTLIYTSGTTGRPKGVMQTHRNLLAMTACYFTDVDDVLPGDAMVYAAPMSHGAGLYNYAQVLRGGGIVGEHSVIFAGESETLTLSHSAIDRGLFARGAVTAAAWTRGKPPGLYDMQDVLGFKR